MAIHLKILTELDRRRAAREAAELKRDFEKYGRDSSASWAKGFEANSPKVRAAWARVAKAAEGAVSAERQLNATRRESTRMARDVTESETKLAAARDRAAKGPGLAAVVAERRLAETRTQLTRISAARAKVEREMRDAIDDESASVEHINALEERHTRILDQQVRTQTTYLSRKKALNTANREEATALEAVSKAEKDHEKILDRQSKSIEKVRDDTENVTRAQRDHALALRSATDAADAHGKALDRLGKRNKGFLESTRRNLGALTPFGTLTPGALLPVVAVMGSAAEAVVTASQSLALLPAVATAAAAGIGTLTIGLHGFSDTIKDMGDPKKFAEGLATLAPNAQQAALEIKALVDGPLGDLKKATQDALFANVPEQLHNLANVFTPTIQGMTTSIATSFNEMFNNLANQLMTPDMQGRIGEIVNNITTMFKALEPAIGPLVDAFMRITQTGSTFLPGLGKSIADLMTRFDNFIIRVQSSGQLQDFIQKGIDAAKALGEFLLHVGQDIYEVFGNKSPEEFRATLEQVRETVKAVAAAIVGIAEAINNLLPIANSFADAVGGWDTVFTVVAGLFVAKWMKAFAAVLGIKGLGGVTKGLLGLPAAADTAATGILGSFTRLGTITIPVVLGIAAGWAGSHLLQSGHNVAPLTGDVGMPEAFPGAPGLPGGALQGEPQAPVVPAEPVGTIVPAGTPGAVPVPGRNEWYIPAGPGGLTPGAIAGTHDIPPELLPTAGLGPYAPHDVPGIPGPPESKSARRDRLRAELAPESYRVDPYAGMTTGGPTGPSMYAPSNQPGPGGLAPALNSLQQMLEQQFPGQLNFSGVRPDALPFHPGGRALDIGIPNWNTPQGKAFGDQLNAFLQAQGPALGLESTIWQDFLQPIGGQGHALGRMNQGPDEAHLTHIHAQVATANAAGNLGPVGPQYNAFGQQTGFGAFQVDPAEVQRKDFDVRQAAHNLEESKKDLLAAQADNTATAEEINDLEWKVQEKKQALLEAQQGLSKAQTGTFEKMKGSTDNLKDGMQQIGAELDKDFGISKGLPGLAENLTKFLANLAFAPVLGALSGVTAAYGTAGKGTGLLGMLAPRENVFGQPMPNVLGQYSPEQLQQMQGGQGQPGGPMMMGPGQQGQQGHLNPATWGANWEAIAASESGGNWGITYGQGAPDNPVTGGLQIGDKTWADNGGLQYGVPHAYMATKEQQIAVAENVLRSQGPGAWPHTFVPAGRPPGPTGYQTGGIVPGYGNGDKVPALLEPGEMVIPAANVDPQHRGTWWGLDPNFKQGLPGQRRGASGEPGPGLQPGPDWYPRGPWGRNDIRFPWEPHQIFDPYRMNRRGVFGLQEGGYIDQQGNYHPFDPNAGRSEPNAGAGLEPPKAPPFLPMGHGPGQTPIDVAPANRRGIPAPQLSSQGPFASGPLAMLPQTGGPTPGPFATLPGQAPPGPAATYVPGQPLPQGPAGVLNPANALPLPPRAVEPLPTTPAGRYPGQGLNLPKGEGIKPGGGIIGLAESAAVSAAAAAGGIGSFGAGGAAAAAAAQIAIDEINRAIQFGGQVAGIAVQGLMETFLPNESPLADIGGGWLGRVAGAVAGASAAAPNIAGAIGQMLQKKPGEQGQPGQPGEQVPPPGDQAPLGTPASGVGTGSPPGPVTTNNVSITAANANPNEIANVATQHLTAMYQGPGR